MMTTKQTFWRTLAAVTAMLLTMPATVWAQSTFGGGSGTISDPYKIYNPGHFVQLADEVNAGNTFEGVYFKLTSSVDFRLYGQIPPIGGRYYTEDGATGIRRFCGNFLGNNRTLYNLTITENPDQCGLFGCLGYGGLVMELTIDGNSTITGIGDCGAIVGSAEMNTDIINCTVGENVVVKVHPDAAAYNYKPGTFGGIVGFTHGRVMGCVSKATISISDITKTTDLGGIAGAVGSDGKVSDCYFLGTVEGVNSVGDIAGTNDGRIENCYYHTSTRHGAVNGADTDGAKWMGTVTMADGVSGALPQATYVDGNKAYFGADKYMLLTLNYSAPDGYIIHDNQVSYMANDVAIGETERAGQPCYEFTMPAEDVTISAVVDLKRDIAYSRWVQIYIPSLTYTGEPLSPTAQVIDIQDGAQQPLTEGEHFTVTWPDEIIDAGEYTATVNGIGDWAGSTNVTFRVEAGGSVARIVTHPTAIEGLTYNGHAQVLINAGEVEGGVMLYRLENGEYSTELPTAISVGSYTVYYKAHSDGNHLDTSELSLVVQISQPMGTWDGEGTSEAPYLIKSVKDMNLIALKMEEMGDYSGVYFSLVNDLDYANAEQLPIGTLQRRFNGTFYGNGHTFTNMVINRPDDTNVAIFAVVGDNGVISDLHLGEGCAITGGTCVGGFVGLFSGAISDCTTAPGVTVQATYNESGGIAGRCVGTIERCVNQASVSADNSQAGGIAASAYNSSSASVRIMGNLNLGSVTANKNAGGIVGYYSGSISSSQSPYSNNYYAGNCNTGAINGRDFKTMAQRGYTVTGGDNVVVEAAEGATVGLTFNNVLYAGAGQQVTITLSAQDGADVPGFVASGGELVDNGDGTWALTMPNPGEDVTISIERILTITDMADVIESGEYIVTEGHVVAFDDDAQMVYTTDGHDNWLPVHVADAGLYAQAKAAAMLSQIEGTFDADKTAPTFSATAFTAAGEFTADSEYIITIDLADGVLDPKAGQVIKIQGIWYGGELRAFSGKYADSNGNRNRGRSFTVTGATGALVPDTKYTIPVAVTLKEAWDDEAQAGAPRRVAKSGDAAFQNLQGKIIGDIVETPIPTGISDLGADAIGNGQRYNLMGQPVGPDYRGIVIVDGKKLLVR